MDYKQKILFRIKKIIITKINLTNVDILNANYFVLKEIKKYLIFNYKQLGSSVLDFGCGDSPYYEYLKSINYTGVDLKLNHQKKNLIKIEINKPLPFKDSKFDSIISTQVIYQVRELDKLIIDFHRVLKTNGVILVTVPFMWFEIYENSQINRRFSKNELEEVFKKGGFKLVNFKPLNVGLEGLCILFLKNLEKKLNAIKIRVLRVPLRMLFNLIINLFLFFIHHSRILEDNEIYLNSGFIFQKHN